MLQSVDRAVATNQTKEKQVITETLVTIDDNTLTTITAGGGGNAWQQCLVQGGLNAAQAGKKGGWRGAAVGAAWGCASALVGAIPWNEKAPPSTYKRAGMPYATESRL
jgi:hypothetical protein